MRFSNCFNLSSENLRRFLQEAAASRFSRCRLREQQISPKTCWVPGPAILRK